jgi:DNA polymerase-3 subunit alpha
LGAIKNVGDGVTSHIVAERKANKPFKSLDDFCKRVDMRLITKRALECLIKVDALRAFGRREPLLAVLDRIVDSAQRSQRAAAVGQIDMFGGAMESVSFITLPDMSENLKDCLAWEKELLGIYVSDHPLKRILPYVEQHATATVGQIDASRTGEQVILAGMVTSVRVITTKKGDPMAFVQLEDLQGSIEVTVFPRLYARTQELWQVDTPVVLHAKIEERDGKLKLLADSAEELPQESTASTPESVVPLAIPTTKATAFTIPTKSPAATVPKPTTAATPTRTPTPPPNGHATNGNGKAKANDKSNGKNDEKQPKPLRHHLFITIPRSGDLTTDMHRVGQVYELLQQYPGEDQFSLYTINSAGRVRLDFPNTKTKHSIQLHQKLVALLGEGAVKVQTLEEETKGNWKGEK